jgi:hypothetical protein
MRESTGSDMADIHPLTFGRVKSVNNLLAS